MRTILAAPVSVAEVMSAPRPETITPADIPTVTVTTLLSVEHGYDTSTYEG